MKKFVTVFAIIAAVLCAGTAEAARYARLRATVASNSSGMGAVNASASTAAGTYSTGNSDVTLQKSGSFSWADGDVTGYLFAKPNTGYVFQGWAMTDNATTYLSSSSPYSVTLTTDSGSASGATRTTYYAIFAEAVCRLASNGKSYTSIEDALAEAAATDTIVLLKNLTLSESFTVSKNITLTSDTGSTYTLTRSGATTGITVAGGSSLTLGDIVVDGNNVNASTSMVNVGDGGTFTLSDGATIQNCKTTGKGGAVYAAGGVVNAAGGTIANCSAAQGGGAVYLDEGGLGYATYYRLTLQKTYGNNTSLSLAEFGLVDSNGNRINQGTYTYDGAFSAANASAAIQNLQPNHVIITGGNVTFSENDPTRLFDGTTGRNPMTINSPTFNNNSGNYRAIVFRVPDGANPAAKYYFYSGSTRNYYLNYWTLERSYDGETWTQIDKQTLNSRLSGTYTKSSDYTISPSDSGRTVPAAVMNVSGNSQISGNTVGGVENNVQPVAENQVKLAGAFSGSVGVSWPDSSSVADGVQFGLVTSGSGAEGFYWDGDSASYYGVADGSNLIWEPYSTEPVCRIGPTEYTSLKAAVDAARDGDTIVLLTDIEQRVALSIPKDVTITSEEGSTYAITRTGTGACFNVDGDVTLENITIDGASLVAGTAMFNVSGGNSLTIAAGTTIRNCNSTTNGGAINNGGTLNLNGGLITDNSAANGGAIYSAGAVNVSGTATVTDNKNTANADSNLQVSSANLIRIAGPFTGSIGVAYPAAATSESPFGTVGTYSPTAGEARKFIYDGNAGFHGKVIGGRLVWVDSSVTIHTGDDIADIFADSDVADDPLTIFIGENMDIGNVVIPAGRDVVIDLQGRVVTGDITASGNVRITDSSELKSGLLDGTLAEDGGKLAIEWGSFTSEPQDEWLATGEVDRIAIDNDDGTWTVTVISGSSELHKCTLDTRLGVRLVNDPAEDIIPLTYASSNFVYRMSDDSSKKTFVGVAPAYPPMKSDGTLTPLSEAEWHKGLTCNVAVADGDKSYDYPLGNYNITHDEFIEVYNGPGESSVVWQEWCWGLVEAIHSNQCGVIRAWYKFPDPQFRVTQRDDTTRSQQKTVGSVSDGNVYWVDETGTDRNVNKYDILLPYDYLSSHYGFSRIGSDKEQLEDIRDHLDDWCGNGLRVWENLVTGTDPDLPYLSAIDPDSVGSPAGQGASGGANPNTAIATIPSVFGTDEYFGYDYWYDLRRATNWWSLVGGTRDKNPRKTVALYADDNDNSRDPTGLYKVFTLIVPDSRQAITNEIPTKNVIGVLKVESTMTNTMVNIPWKSLAHDPEFFLPQTVVSNLTKTTNLEPGDRVYCLDGNYKNGDPDADNQDFYQAWMLNEDYKWEAINTLKVNEYGTNTFTKALSPEQKELFRGGGVWVVRDNPTRIDASTGKEVAKPFFIYGQFETNDVSTTINGSDSYVLPVYTMLGIPGIYGIDINKDIDWGGNPIVNEDVITIPRETAEPLKLRWAVVNGVGSWGYTKTTVVVDPKTKRRRTQSVRVTDIQVPRGHAFWYTRRGPAFNFKWKLDWPKAGLEEYFGWEKYPEPSKPEYDPPALIGD